jgi:hypothetical protein
MTLAKSAQVLSSMTAENPAFGAACLHIFHAPLPKSEKFLLSVRGSMLGLDGKASRTVSKDIQTRWSDTWLRKVQEKKLTRIADYYMRRTLLGAHLHALN